MLEEIIKNPDLDRYCTTFEAGQIIFLERDESHDLYILVSGELDVLKGKKIISEITEKGSLFGEMSLLLEARRTATVRARSDVKAICIPQDEVTNFLGKFPDVARAISCDLARRLDEATQILYGLNELYDQLPDAVILTDREGKILSWNTTAETLYGRGWTQMRHKSAEEIYEEPEIYRDFLDEVQEKYAVREKILKIIHPEKGTLFVSTSMTVLYDGHHNFQGVLSLGRDVTAAQKLERKYRRVRNWLLPILILFGFLVGAGFFIYPQFFKEHYIMDTKKQDLRNQLAKDYLVLKSLLAGPFMAGKISETSQLMKEFFDIQENTEIPYTGLILLGKNKKVFNSYSMKMREESKKMIGSSYGGIAFHGNEKSIHKVLTLYRTTKEHPMGHRAVEIAFRMNKGNYFLGWLVFQMDMDLLAKAYGIDEEGLKKFRFKKP